MSADQDRMEQLRRMLELNMGRLGVAETMPTYNDALARCSELADEILALKFPGRWGRT